MEQLGLQPVAQGTAQMWQKALGALKPDVLRKTRICQCFAVDSIEDIGLAREKALVTRNIAQELRVAGRKARQRASAIASRSGPNAGKGDP